MWEALVLIILSCCSYYLQSNRAGKLHPDYLNREEGSLLPYTFVLCCFSHFSVFLSFLNLYKLYTIACAIETKLTRVTLPHYLKVLPFWSNLHSTTNLHFRLWPGVSNSVKLTFLRLHFVVNLIRNAQDLIWCSGIASPKITLCTARCTSFIKYCRMAPQTLEWWSSLFFKLGIE